jgi:hypothetical protein
VVIGGTLLTWSLLYKTLAVCSDAAMSERSTRPALQRLSLSAGDHQSLGVVHFGTGVL